MRIGVPKEIKNGEHRVALTPEGAKLLAAAGHRVLVQRNAGLDSGFADSAYAGAGALLVDSAADAWAVDLVVKVKEPLPQEYDYLSPETLLFTYLHLAAVPELAGQLLERKINAIGYETVQTDDGRLPLLAPMSLVAGRVALLRAACYLQQGYGRVPGKGVLLGGIPGGDPGRVVVLGGGNAGRQAAAAAAGLGAHVTVLDASEAALASLRQAFGGRVDAKGFDKATLAALLPTCDVLIGAVLIPGEHAPELLTREMVARMPAGSVLADIAIDQGGISETSRPTSFSDPVYVDAGVIHCCLPNLPAAVPRTSTLALTQATLPYIRMLAESGAEAALAADAALQRGVNTWEGKLVHAGVARGLAEQASSDRR